MAKPTRTRAASAATPLAPASNVIPFPASAAARTRLRHRLHREATFEAMVLAKAQGFRYVPPCASALLDAYLHTSEGGRETVRLFADAVRRQSPYYLS